MQLDLDRKELKNLAAEIDDLDDHADQLTVAAEKVKAVADRAETAAENFCEVYFAEIRTPLRKVRNTLKKMRSMGIPFAGRLYRITRKIMERLDTLCPRVEAEAEKAASTS